MAKLAEPKPGDLSLFGGREGPQESDSKLDELEASQVTENADGDGWADEGRFQQASSLEDAAAEDLEVLQEQFRQDDDPREDEEPYQSYQEEPEAKEEEAEEEEAEELSEEEKYDQLLARVQQTPEATEEDVEASSSKLQERLAYQQGRLEALEERIKERTEAPAPAPDEEKQAPQSGINYSDPALRAALQEAVEDPAKLGPTIAVLARKEAEALIESELSEVRETLKTREDELQDQQEREAVRAKINSGLQAAYQMGGLEAAIVREAYDKGESSLLFQYLGNGNQALATTPQGMLTAVLAVARAVEKADSQPAPEPEAKAKETPPAPSKKRSTVASTRGRNMRKPKQSQSPEEAARERIRNARPQIEKIPFMR